MNLRSAIAFAALATSAFACSSPDTPSNSSASASSSPPSDEPTASTGAALSSFYANTPFAGPGGAACSFQGECFSAGAGVSVLCPSSVAPLTITNLTANTPAAVEYVGARSPTTTEYFIRGTSNATDTFQVCSTANPSQCGSFPFQFPSGPFCPTTDAGGVVSPEVTLDPSETQGYMQLFPGVTEAYTSSISGLPSGVTATPKPVTGTGGSGVEYDFTVAAGAPATHGPVFAEVTVSFQWDAQVANATYPFDVCVAIPASDFQCGRASDGCGNTYTLPACPTHFACTANQCVYSPTCPKGTHSCGDGTCGIVCQ